MNKKVKPTKTLNPLHFEDLDPHRFEDLVRNLIYDFKKWKSIEATGRGGGDDGFDVRAWEQTQEVTNIEEENGETGTHPMEGNLWKIQCKREKKLGPSRINEIIDEGVEKKTPPYGYILVAPTNYSKQSYDAFRNGLRQKGVMEFYLWGKAELEDMLYLPKNDSILFAFFGISLATKKRSKTTELKFAINNKNKLLRILSGGSYLGNIRKSILIRDYNDTHYPYKEQYGDFDKNPRWEEHIVVGYHPLGLFVQTKKYYAFADYDKKEWDCTKAVDLVVRQGRQQNTDENDKIKEKVGDFYKYMPRDNQAYLSQKGLLFFEDILIVDEHGDVSNSYPHIYAEFVHQKGPFRSYCYKMEMNGQIHQAFYLNDSFKRVKIFPHVFPEIKKGKVYEDKMVEVAPETLSFFKTGYGSIKDLLDVDGKYKFLNVKDIIWVASGEKEQEKVFIRVTFKYTTTVNNYMSKTGYFKGFIEKQVGRNLKDNEDITVYEIERAYDWQIKD